MPQDRKTKNRGRHHFLRRQLRRQLKASIEERAARMKERNFIWQSVEKIYTGEQTDGGKDDISKDAGWTENRLTVMCMPENTVTAKRNLTGPKHGTGMPGTRSRHVGVERFPILSDTGFTVW